MFKETLDLHLKAINERNLEVFLSTVATDKVRLILPNGQLITGKEAFNTFHKSWFEDLDWSIKSQTISVECHESLSTALLDVIYYDLDTNGNKTELTYYLYLVFEKIDEKWYLIHDQNTLK